MATSTWGPGALPVGRRLRPRTLLCVSQPEVSHGEPTSRNNYLPGCPSQDTLRRVILPAACCQGAWCRRATPLVPTGPAESVRCAQHRAQAELRSVLHLLALEGKGRNTSQMLGRTRSKLSLTPHTQTPVLNFSMVAGVRGSCCGLPSAGRQTCSNPTLPWEHTG